MTPEGMNKFLNALKSANIKEYQFDSDLGTHFYNNANAILFTDDDVNMMINVRRRYTREGFPYEGDVFITCADYGDLHEVRFGATYEKTVEFLTAIGITPNEEQMKIIVEIDKKNYEIKPLTGDYNPTFVEKTDEEIANLTAEQKAKYEKDLADFKAETLKRLKNLPPVSVKL